MTELPSDKRAVVLVAETLQRYGPMHGIRVARRRWWRPATPFDYVPVAREIVASLFLLPDGRALSADVLATIAPVDAGSA